MKDGHILILNQTEVRRLLTMPECMDVMAGALRATARGQVILPLRPVMWLPDKLGGYTTNGGRPDCGYLGCIHNCQQSTVFGFKKHDGALVGIVWRAMISRKHTHDLDTHVTQCR